MSNVNIGGLESDLVLNTREWIQPGREALASLRNLGNTTATVLDGMNRASDSTFRDMGGRLRDSSGRFVAFGGSVRTAADGVNQSFASMGKACREIQQSLSGLTRTARDVVGKSVSEFAKLDQAMHDVDSIAKLSSDQLAKVTKQVRDMGGEMGLTQGPNKLADALKAINGAGYDAADSLKILRAAAKGADAGGTDSKTFSRGVTSLLRNYNLGADHSTVVTDQMFKAMDQGSIDASELASSIGSIAPVASQAGVSMQELMGSLSAMSLNGKSFSENVTNYRSALLHVLAPAEDGRKLLKAYGIQAGETAIRTKGLVGVLKDIQQKTGGNQNAQKKILDDEGLQATAALLKGDKGATTQGYIQQQYKADGATDDSFKRRAQGLIFQFDQVKAAFENFAVGVGTGLEPVLKPAADGINKIAQALLKIPDSTKAAIGGFAGIVAVGGSMLSGLVLLAPNFVQLEKLVTSFGAAARKATVAGGILEGGLSGIGAAAAEIAAPIALLAGVVATIATGWKNDWGGIREFTNEVMGDIRSAVSSTSTWIKDNLGPVARTVAADFQAVWPDLKEFFGWLGKGAFDLVVPAVKKFYDNWKITWSLVSATVKYAWDTLKPAIDLVKDGVFALGKTVWDIIQGDYKKAWSDAVEFVRTVPGRLTSAFTDIVKNARAGFSDLANTVRDGFRKAFSWDETPSLDLQQLKLTGEILRSQLNRSGLADSFGNFLKPIEDGFTSASTGLTRFVNTAAVQFDEVTANAKGKAKEIFDAFNPLKSPYSSKDRMGGGPGTNSDDPLPDTRSHRAAAKKVSRGEMQSFIRGNAGVIGDIGGLDDETLKATYKLVQNSVLAKYKLWITSAKRPDNGHSFHGVGKAVDIQAFGMANNFGDRQQPRTIMDLSAGTGFRSGLDEYRPDTARYTKATGAHVHLTTGLEKQPGQGGLPGAFLVKGGSGGAGSVVAAIQETLRKWNEDTKVVAGYLSKSASEFDRQKAALRTEYEKAAQSAKDIGADDKTLRQLAVNYKREVNQVHEAERRENEKTVTDLIVTRLEAEGKMGEAAKARIAATAQAEKERMLDVLNSSPQHGELVYSAIKAVDANAARQQEVAGLQQGADRFASSRDIQDFRLQDPGIHKLIAAFPEFRAEVEAAYAAVQRYIADPVEANRAAFEQGKQFLESNTAAVQEASRRRIEAIEYERALGQISTDEAIARRGQELANWVGGEDSKRQAILQFSDVYREHLQRSLELQGEFTLEGLQSMADSLMQAGQLTEQQQAKLIAVNQLIQQQRVQDQQTWQGILQSSTGAFQGFLTGILTGQQSFSQSFTQLWKGIATQVVQEIVKMIVKATILQKILSGIFSWFGGILGIGGAAPIAGINVGEASSAAATSLGFSYHTGGYVTHGGPAGLPRFHSGGFTSGFSRHTSGPLRSDELMAVLQTGEYVLSRQQLAAVRAGAQAQGRQGNTVHVGGITVQATVSNEMDIDRLANQLGRQINYAMQGVG